MSFFQFKDPYFFLPTPTAAPRRMVDRANGPGSGNTLLEYKLCPHHQS